MVSSVAFRLTGGTVMPLRCFAPPSSVGAGIWLQSGACRLGWFISLLHHSSLRAKRSNPSFSLVALWIAWSLRPRNDDCFSSPCPQQAALLAAPIALLQGLALVVQLLALGNGQQQLCAAAFVEIQFERDQRQPLAVDRADQFVDLLLVQQQFSRALGLVVEAIGDRNSTRLNSSH